MKKLQLIVNADDFGLHPSINDGIVVGHQQGIITSTSIMASGQAFAHACKSLQAVPKLGVGVHLTVVGAQSVSDKDRIPSLVDEEGWFCAAHPQFIQRYITGKIKQAEVRSEWRAQIEKVQSAGIKVTHLDSHQHMHILPGLAEVTCELAKEFGISAIRIPDEPYGYLGLGPWTMSRFISRGGLTLLARRARKFFRRQGVHTPDYFYGMLEGGNMSATKVQHMLERLRPGVTEIMVHPGADNQQLGQVYPWQYQWEAELAALTDGAVQQQIRDRDIRLVSFGVF